MLNSATMRICSRAAAPPAPPGERQTARSPRRRPGSGKRPATPFTISSASTTSGVGAIGVRPIRMRKVRQADGCQREHDRDIAGRRGPGASAARQASRSTAATFGMHGDCQGRRLDCHATVAPPRIRRHSMRRQPVRPNCNNIVIKIQQQAGAHPACRRHGSCSDRALRITWMSRSRIFLRSVLRLTPSSSAALI